jgi:hypothetical protein
VVVKDVALQVVPVVDKEVVEAEAEDKCRLRFKVYSFLL